MATNHSRMYHVSLSKAVEKRGHFKKFNSKLDNFHFPKQCCPVYDSYILSRLIVVHLNNSIIYI